MSQRNSYSIFYLQGFSVILNNRGKDPEDLPGELVSFLDFTRKSLPESEEETEDTFIKRLQESIRRVKGSRELGERNMTLQEILQEEWAEGRKIVIFQMVNENEISMEKGAEKLGLSPKEFQEKLKEYLKTQA